jgi:hypothetical protein
MAAGGLSACGGGSKTSSTQASQLSPAQYENYQRIGGYLKAGYQLELAAYRPPSEHKNFAQAVTRLRTLIGGLGALTPPPQFKESHEKLLTSFRSELATSLAYEAAQRAHNAAALNHASQQNLEAEQASKAALVEQVAELRKCEGDRFSC